MSTMGSYCKAYELKDLRAFSDWDELEGSDGDSLGTDRDLDDSSIVYLQEDYTVTDGVYLGEHVIFNDVTEAWKTFCHETLDFEIPDDVKEMKEEAEKAKADASGSEA